MSRLLGFCVLLFVSCSKVEQPDKQNRNSSGILLHSDKSVERVAHAETSRTNGNVSSMLAAPPLDIVPPGGTARRSIVFHALGFSDDKLTDFQWDIYDQIVIMSWQVSRSYRIICMTSATEGSLTSTSLAEPDREIYGIRIIQQ